MTMNNKKLLIQRLIFIICLLILAIGCLVIMNLNYDRLSRYPYNEYMSEQDKETIKNHLNDEQIEYIIEYSIAPNTFLKYINCSGFSIYHNSEYMQLADYLGYGSACEIVSKVELTRNQISIADLANLMAHYTSSEIDYWFSYKDLYNPDSILVTNPDALDVYLDTTYTMSNHIPGDLVELDDSIAQDDTQQYDGTFKDILVSSKILIPLSQMCNALSEEFEGNCGGLIVEDGYRDFNSQATLYTDAINTYGDQAVKYEAYPGHCEHQTGLAIDFKLVDDTIEFKDSEQFQWLQQHASEYGFYATYLDKEGELNNSYSHYRYTGVKTPASDSN